MGMENQLKKWFDGKSVAIIGNSKKLLSQEWGSFIDSHDVVVRFNHAWRVVPPQSEKYTKSLGTRTDVLCVNLIRSAGFHPGKLIKRNFKMIQITACGVDKKWHGCYDLICEDPQMRWFLDKFSQKPSTGIRTLHIFSEFCDPHKVNVFGFDWKQEAPSWYGGRDDYMQKDHDYLEEKQYCWDNFFNHPEKKSTWTLVT